MLSLPAIFGVFFLRAKQRIEQTDDETQRSFHIGLFTAALAFSMVNLTALRLVRGPGIFFGMFLGLFQALSKMDDEDEEEARLPYSIGRATAILRTSPN